MVRVLSLVISAVVVALSGAHRPQRIVAFDKREVRPTPDAMSGTWYLARRFTESIPAQLVSLDADFSLNIFCHLGWMGGQGVSPFPWCS
jgi:hypothetical protein